MGKQEKRKGKKKRPSTLLEADNGKGKLRIGDDIDTLQKHFRMKDRAEVEKWLQEHGNPNARDVINLIDQEQDGRANLILQLYDTGANTEQIQGMLQRERNAETLIDLISEEQDGRANLILQLYEDGATSEEITAMLRFDNNAAEIHRLMTNTGPDNLRVNNIQFVSMEGETVGSIYFPRGRIRLYHREGPMVDITGDNRIRIERYDVPQTLLEEHGTSDSNLKNIYNEGRLNAEDLINGQVGNRLRGNLIDYSVALLGGTDSAVRAHRSRGSAAPLPVGLEQRHLNIIYNIARDAMNAQPRQGKINYGIAREYNRRLERLFEEIGHPVFGQMQLNKD